MTPRSVRWFGSLAIILVVLASCEFIAYLATTFLVSKGLYFCPLRIDEPYEMYQRRLQPTLGWPFKNYINRIKNFYDVSGSRLIPAFPDPHRTPPCVSLYGDSFTEATGVDHEHAWSNVLSLLLNCRASNFGVAGYGTDQAYLRFALNTQDPAQVVILGIFPENIKRNVNQLRNLISTVTICQTKPRFILNNHGETTLVPIPSLSRAEYSEIKDNPGRFLHHEYFLPGGPSGRQMARFPYLWGMIQVSPFIVKNLLFGSGNYQAFYQPDHPSQGLEVMTAIIEEFCRTAHKRGKRPVVLIIPTDYDILTYQRHQKWNYQPLLDRLAQRRLEYIDAGPQIIKHLGGGDRQKLYSPQIQNHLNHAGNRLLARIVYDFLTTRNILKR